MKPYSIEELDSILSDPETTYVSIRNYNEGREVGDATEEVKRLALTAKQFANSAQNIYKLMEVLTGISGDAIENLRFATRQYDEMANNLSILEERHQKVLAILAPPQPLETEEQKSGPDISEPANPATVEAQEVSDGQNGTHL